MKIGIISDTHDHVEHVDLAVKKFTELGVETVFHAGDYCSPFTVPPFKGFSLVGVFGNNDGDHYRLIQKFRDINGSIHNEYHEAKLGGRSIALYHGTQPAITKALVASGFYDIVISGHTHTPVNEIQGDTISFNPGSAHGFGKQATLGVYDTDNNKAEHINL